MRVWLALVLFACGGSSSSSAADAGNASNADLAAQGAECSLERPCAPGLDCLVKDQATMRSPLTGVCEPTDPACASGCTCTPSVCLRRPACTAITSGGDEHRTIGCFTKLLDENETCELGVGCKDGLFCLVPSEGAPGTCKPIPAACNARSFCSCPEMKTQCAPNEWQGCSGLADVYFVRCRPAD